MTDTTSIRTDAPSNEGIAGPRREVPRVLSIAGTDPTGGAGIQADLKSIAACGGYGMAVVTALVAQNTRGVRGVHVPPVEFLREQLDAVADDVEIDAVKLGMLVNAEVMGAVAAWLDERRVPIVVLDPVMVATSGDRLLSPEGESAMRELARRADLVTPNRMELAVLAEEEVAPTWALGLEQAARVAARCGTAVLAKGGHFDDEGIVMDALVAPSGEIVEFPGERVDTRCTHGTGCSLSSAVATLRARRGDWTSAVREAKAWLGESLRAADALEVGGGHGPISHFAGLWRTAVSPADPASLVDEWWSSVEEIRDATDELPFVRGLVDGTLQEATFAWYLAQDALYLRDYARALAAASAIAPSAEEQAFWAASAEGAIAAEVALHAQWLGEGALFDAVEAPATSAYVDHLLAPAARGDYGTLIAGILPCFWMYLDIGERMLERSAPGNPYQPWLDAYSDEGFKTITDRAIALVAAHAARSGDAERARMREAFRRSARHEHDFFLAPTERSDAGGDGNGARDR